MTITLDLPPEIEASFVAEARAKGIPLDEMVKSLIVRHTRSGGDAVHPSPYEIDRGLEEAADLIPDGIPPLPDEALSRANIYTREDDWHR